MKFTEDDVKQALLVTTTFFATIIADTEHGDVVVKDSVYARDIATFSLRLLSCNRYLTKFHSSESVFGSLPKKDLVLFIEEASNVLIRSQGQSLALLSSNLRLLAKKLATFHIEHYLSVGEDELHFVTCFAQIIYLIESTCSELSSLRPKVSGVILSVSSYSHLKKLVEQLKRMLLSSTFDVYSSWALSSIFSWQDVHLFVDELFRIVVTSPQQFDKNELLHLFASMQKTISKIDLSHRYGVQPQFKTSLHSVSELSAQIIKDVVSLRSYLTKYLGSWYVLYLSLPGSDPFISLDGSSYQLTLQGVTVAIASVSDYPYFKKEHLTLVSHFSNIKQLLSQLTLSFSHSTSFEEKQLKKSLNYLHAQFSASTSISFAEYEKMCLATQSLYSDTFPSLQLTQKEFSYLFSSFLIYFQQTLDHVKLLLEQSSLSSVAFKVIREGKVFFRNRTTLRKYYDDILSCHEVFSLALDRFRVLHFQKTFLPPYLSHFYAEEQLSVLQASPIISFVLTEKKFTLQDISVMEEDIVRLRSLLSQTILSTTQEEQTHELLAKALHLRLVAVTSERLVAELHRICFEVYTIAKRVNEPYAKGLFQKACSYSFVRLQKGDHKGYDVPFGEVGEEVYTHFQQTKEQLLLLQRNSHVGVMSNDFKFLSVVDRLPFLFSKQLHSLSSHELFSLFTSLQANSFSLPVVINTFSFAQTSFKEFLTQLVAIWPQEQDALLKLRDIIVRSILDTLFQKGLVLDSSLNALSFAQLLHRIESQHLAKKRWTEQEAFVRTLGVAIRKRQDYWSMLAQRTGATAVQNAFVSSLFESVEKQLFVGVPKSFIDQVLQQWARFCEQVIRSNLPERVELERLLLGKKIHLDELFTCIGAIGATHGSTVVTLAPLFRSLNLCLSAKQKNALFAITLPNQYRSVVAALMGNKG